MKTKKVARRALFTSVLALVLCVSMLVGTTFAWFTDSVTSSNNIIKSGTLDVTMQWKDATTTGAQQTYVDASTGAIFDYDLWEPGYVDAKNIQISNVGTLALKYQLNILANGEVSELADVIDVYFAEGEMTLADRTMTGLTRVGTLTEVLAGMPSNVSGDLEAKDTDTVTIALKMQESAGNEYQDLSIGSDFSVQLLATQLTAEEDSFDDQYDAKADYVAKFTSGTHELNTTLMATKAGDTVSATGAETVVNIRGGYYDAGSIYNNCAVWAYAGSTINIYDGTFTADGDDQVQGSGHHYDLIYAGSSNDTAESHINIYGGMFSVEKNGWLLNEADGKGVITVYGGTFVNWNPANNESEGANTNFLADGYAVTAETKANGDVWYTVIKAVTTFDALQEAMNNGETVALGADIDANKITLRVPEGTTATLDLNGYTFTSLDGGSGNNYALSVSKGANLTLKGDGKIVASCYGVSVLPNAKFTMDDGEIVVRGNGEYDYGVVAWNGATFVMNGGKIIASVDVYPSFYSGYISTSDKQPTVVINDGELIKEKESKDLNDPAFIKTDCEPNVTINGGTFDGVEFSGNISDYITDDN